MAGRQSGFNAATSFATMVVLVLGVVFTLGIVFAFSEKPEWPAFGICCFFAVMTYWLFSPRGSGNAGMDEMSAISAANRKVITRTHHYKLKKVRKREDKAGSQQPPTAESIREMKESSVVFVAPARKPRTS